MVEFCYDPTFCAHFLSIRKRSVSMRIRKNHLNGNLQEHGKVQWVSGIMDSVPRETWAILSGKQNWRWQATASNLTQHIWEQNIRPHLRSLATKKTGYSALQCKSFAKRWKIIFRLSQVSLYSNLREIVLEGKVSWSSSWRNTQRYATGSTHLRINNDHISTYAFDILQSEW